MTLNHPKTPHLKYALCHSSEPINDIDGVGTVVGTNQLLVKRRSLPAGYFSDEVDVSYKAFSPPASYVLCSFMQVQALQQ